MRQVEYRGYARGQGFNPIQAADNTRRIAEQDQAYIQGMERYASQLQANRQEYSRGLERKFNAEEQNRRANFEWQEQEAQRYQNAVLRNIETERENAARAAQFVGQDKTVLTALSGLSETISKGLIAYDKKVSEDQELEGKNLVFESGLTPDRIARYQAQKQALSQSDANINQLANQLDFEGVPVSVIEQYLNLSGWKKVGATSAMAIQGADNYPVYALQAKDTLELDIGNGKFTMATARNIEEYRAAEAAIRSEYLKNFTGINDALLNEYLFPGMRQYEANERAQFISQYEKNIEDRIQGERATDLLTNSKASGGEGFLDYVNRISGGDRNLIGPTRRQAFETIAKAIESGQMTPSEWESIKDYEFTPRGQSKSVTIGEFYGGEAGVVEQAIAKRERALYEQQQFERNQANDEFDEIVRQKVFGEGATEEEIQQIEEQYMKNGFRVPEFLKSYRTQETKNKEAQREQLIYLANRNLLTTEELLTPGKYDEEVIAQFKDQASKGDQLKGLNQARVSDSLKVIEARMSELLDQVGTDKKASSALLMGMQRAEDIFNRKVLTELKASGDEDLAIEKAQEYVLNLLWNGMGAEQKNGPFALARNPIGSLNPFAFMAGSSGSAAEVVAKMNRIRSNPQILNSQVILSQPELQEIEKFRQGKGGIPSVIKQLSKVTGKPAVDIINAQLTAAGKPPLAPVLSETVRQGMSPLQRFILDYRPSRGSTYQAFGMNPGDGTQPWKPLLDLIASKESTSYGGYEAMNREGADDGHTAIGSANSRNVFPGGLTSMTVAQVMDLHNKKQLHAAGRYQIIAKTMRGLMQGRYGPTGVNLNDRFDAATQDKLAIALVRGRAGKFFSGTGSLDDAVVGMGNEWIGLQYLRPGVVAQALQRTKQALNSPNPFRQPEGMRTNVVYRIDSLGYGSTGPHLDVKPVTPGTMKSNRNLPAYRKGQLDNFVEITLPDGKRGALSQLSTTTDDDRKHRNRGSFGHDYAAPKGSTLRLKNGARYVGSFKGDQGTDHMIIELPDGRRFQFLHGTIG